MFGFLSPKTFGNHSLKFLSKRCAQCSAAESEEMGEDPDHTPEGSCAVLLGATFGAALLRFSGELRRITEDVQAYALASSPQTSSQRGGKPCAPNTYRIVPSCTLQGVLGSAEELIKGQTSF